MQDDINAYIQQSQSHLHPHAHLYSSTGSPTSGDHLSPLAASGQHSGLQVQTVSLHSLAPGQLGNTVVGVGHPGHPGHPLHGGHPSLATGQHQHHALLTTSNSGTNSTSTGVANTSQETNHPNSNTSESKKKSKCACVHKFLSLIYGSQIHYMYIITCAVQ